MSCYSYTVEKFLPLQAEWCNKQQKETYYWAAEEVLFLWIWFAWPMNVIKSLLYSWTNFSSISFSRWECQIQYVMMFAIWNVVDISGFDLVASKYIADVNRRAYIKSLSPTIKAHNQQLNKLDDRINKLRRKEWQWYGEKRTLKNEIEYLIAFHLLFMCKNQAINCVKYLAKFREYLWNEATKPFLLLNIRIFATDSFNKNEHLHQRRIADKHYRGSFYYQTKSHWCSMSSTQS